MYNKSKIKIASFVTMATLIIISCAAAQTGRRVAASGNQVTLTVTAHPHNDRQREAARRLQPDDFSVREDKKPQQIISVKRASEAPPIIAVVIQDDLISRVSNELRDIKEFIRRLPEGSRVMTAYITSGSVQVTQDFTTDRERAASSLRILRSSAAASPFSPYIGVIEALRRFDSQPEGRRLMLLVSDGLDTSRGFQSASPYQAVDLDRAISESARRGVAVFSFFAPSVGLSGVNRTAANFGQGSLNRLSDETGGEAFFSGMSFVTFDPYWKEMNELLEFQWVIAYRSTNTGTGLRRIEVTTDQDVHLHHPKGYRSR